MLKKLDDNFRGTLKVKREIMREIFKERKDKLKKLLKKQRSNFKDK